MANSKNFITNYNISKYATSFIGFDEASGNVYDSIGGYVGTVYNAPTRVTGWNGEGSAMSFNGSNQYIDLPPTFIPYENMVFRFKIKASVPSSNKVIIGNLRESKYNGVRIGVWGRTGQLYLYISNSSKVIFEDGAMGTNVCDEQWHDIVISIINKEVKYYIDDMVNPVYVSNIPSSDNMPTSYTYNTEICRRVYHKDYYFKCELDQIEIYDRAIPLIPYKHLILHNNQHKYHNGTSWQTTTATEENFLQYGHDDLSVLDRKLQNLIIPTTKEGEFLVSEVIDTKKLVDVKSITVEL